MKHKVSKNSKVIAIVLAGAFLVILALSASLVSAAEFKYDKKPAFSITYPKDWVDNPDNAKKYNLLFSVKNPSGVPVLNVQVRDIPPGATLADTGKLFKKLILDPEQGVPTEIISDKLTTLKDGTKANETILKYKWQNTLGLQVNLISVFKDNKWIRVDIHLSEYADPLWEVARTLTFKK